MSLNETKSSVSITLEEPKPTKFSVKIQDKDKKKGKNEGAEITVGEFLDFLKTAYQVTGSLEGMLMSKGLSDTVDWIKLKESNLIKPREAACQTFSDVSVKSDGKKLDGSGSDSESLKRKLSEVINDGLLDSVLPYLVPPTCPTSRKPSLTKSIDKSNSGSSTNLSHSSDPSKRRSSDSLKFVLAKTDSEVIIHVCDEIKNTKRDFVCNQKLLVEKMGYFAEVTVGQKLEDMDISVHCDIGIFEWLIRWIKCDDLPEEERPQLDVTCVIPVLVSAAFLQMEPLLQECLLFCHRHMNEILRTTSNLSCLNDSVLTRLAAMYTNSELEAVRDRKDRIQSRLYCKLIQSLCEPESESVRGHWRSLARVFRCGRCHQLVSPSVGSTIPCVAPCMRLLADGSVSSQHVRDSHWNINTYIEKLQKSLKSWRKVYWHLWGDCHFLYCTLCRRHFSVHQLGWCRFHPDPPQFFTLDSQKAPLPLGRFPCCGERAYRFQLLERPSGCHFKEHTVCTDDPKDAAVLAILETYRHMIEEEPPRLMFPERLTRLVAREPSGDGKLLSKDTFWWEGLMIVQPRAKIGLLGAFKEKIEEHVPIEPEEEYTELSESSCSTSSSTTDGSEEKYRKPVVTKKASPKRTKKKKEGRLWQHNLSARSNQDLQRSHEEAAFKQMTAVLNRFTLSPNSTWNTNRGWMRYKVPPGGIWVRLEAEFKENCINSNPLPPKMRSVYTGKYKLKSNRL